MIEPAIEPAQVWSKPDAGATVDVSGAGSGVGIWQLTDRKVDLAMASREMGEAGLLEAERTTGQRPASYGVRTSSTSAVCS